MIGGSPTDNEKLAKEYILQLKYSAKQSGTIRRIEELIKTFPNDQDLGKAVRNYLKTLENDQTGS